MSNKRDEGASLESQTALERPPLQVGDEGSGALPAGAVLGGRYEVRGVIGRGGMGVVVEAFDGAVGVPVAIKIVRAEYAGERQWIERLAREVKLARKIQHPNVCRVFDFAQADGRAFLIMELASGGTLRSQLSGDAARARPLGERLADARAIAAGVAAIHAAGIVHRDLSTQNVLRMADGRLVVSDFGLATDSFDASTSIHGGTVAYMAPEVVRGGRATFASDVWSLGAVIHEVVFGERLQWDPTRAVMRSEVAAAALTRIERGVLEICRACTALNPERRPRDAREIAARLSEARLARMARRRWRQGAITAAISGLMMVAALLGVRRVQSAWRRSAEAGPAIDPLLIVPRGEPDDWTDKAKVLAEIPGKLRCLVTLPDRHTIRFLWGYPPRAEDVDMRTGERKPSPLVPDAYAEGCPGLSPDGRRLVYAGHVADDRAFAFVSANSDGRDAIPEVQTAEPSVNSDPVWLADGDSFVYDVDEKHVAVFSTVTKRSVVMPSAVPPSGAPAIYTVFHEAIENQVFVNAVYQDPVDTEVAGFLFPRLGEVTPWKVPGIVPSFASRDGKTFYYAYVAGLASDLVEIEPSRKRARILGTLRGRSIGHPLFVEEGLALVDVAWDTELVLRSPGAAPVYVPTSQGIGMAARCGQRIIAGQRKGSMEVDVVWLDERGTILGSVAQHGNGQFPACSSDGSIIFSGSLGEHPGVERCDGNGCRTIFSGPAAVLAISPDDKRLAFMSIDGGGATIRWISSDGRGAVHEIADTDNPCAPIWASDKDIWVSLQKGRRQVWTEIDTDSGRPTGRTSPGSRNCADGLPDPDCPLHSPVEVEVNIRSRLRLLPSKYLPPG